MTKQLKVNDLGDEAIASLKVLVVRSPHTNLDSLQTCSWLNYQCVATKADYLAHLNRDVDLILADYRSTQLPAIEALRLLQETSFKTPLIVINGSPQVAVAVEHMKAGAADYLIDTTDLPRAVKALTSHPQQQTQNKLQTLITENADGIIVVDRHRRVQFVNAAALTLLGRQAEELLNQPFGFPVVDSDYLEVDLPSKTGDRVAQMRVTEIFWQGSAYLVSLRDITALKRAEAERIQLLEQAQAANRAKDEFLAVLSHELRTPLNPILGWTQLLQNRQLDEIQTQKALAIIERNANLQVQLIEDLLDISRIIQGRLKLQIYPVNLKAAIANALETVQLAAQAKSIQIQTHLAPDVDLVQGDPTRLQQIIWNLLSNAIKFTPAGGCVEVRLAAIGTDAQIQISDTGQGIAPQFLPYVFDYFRQADSATTRAFGGLGLGLAIVRQLVELHGGSVKADSPGEGQGATFTVTLPLSAHREEPDAKEPTKQPNLKGDRILVVDDEADTRDLLVFVLEPVGMVVKTAASGAEALEAITSFQPQLLISDIGMPGMDGYELIRAVRALPPEQGRIPALSLSAFSADSDKQRSLEAGFNDHLTKPTDLERLVLIVAQILGQNQG